MELERRIEKLEQEVEILKHQIQETLLEIQEKMLNNTYPSLRSSAQTQPEPEEELSPSERPTQLHRPESKSQQREQRHTQNPQPPKQKVVSITDYTGTPAKNAPVPETSDIDWEELDRMESWVLHKLKSLGIAKTRKLIRLHMSKGRMSKEMGMALTQFVSLYDKQQREPAPTGAKQEEPAQEEPGEQNLILRLIAGVSNAGTKGRKHG